MALAFDQPEITIIGGGASGVMLAYHILKLGSPDLKVTLIERENETGFGLAYSTRNPSHLLNVRNSNMSAIPEEPNHFINWLVRNGGVNPKEIDPSGFSSRQTFGRYIADLIKDFRSANRLQIIHGNCIRIKPIASGVRMDLADGSAVESRFAVIATGYDLPQESAYSSPWNQNELRQLQKDDPVLIIGSGLTMIDYVLTLLDKGHTGKIEVISRRGLIPNQHKPVSTWPIKRTDIPAGGSITMLMRWIRKEISRANNQGFDWRSVIDGLRPHTQYLWQTFPLHARARFLRHARPWWDIARHRMAPEIASRVEAAIADGQLRVRAGKITKMTCGTDSCQVQIRCRGEIKTEKLKVSRVVGCTGLPVNSGALRDALTASLLTSRMARLDPLGLGLEVTSKCSVINEMGTPSDCIFAVGPATRSQFWEIVAIPDIRNQCASLARDLVNGINANRDCEAAA